jgi:hypothetical protein
MPLHVMNLGTRFGARFDKHIAKPPTIEKIEDLLKNAPKKISKDR